MITRTSRTRKLTALTTWCLGLVAAGSFTGCKPDDTSDTSPRQSASSENLRQEIARASVVVHTTYKVSTESPGFCEERIVAFLKGKELEQKLARWGEDALSLTPLKEDGSCLPDSIAFYAPDEASENKSSRPFSQYFINDGKIHGGMTVEELRAALLQEKSEEE